MLDVGKSSIVTDFSGSYLGNLAVDCSYAGSSGLVDDANLSAQCHNLPGQISHCSRRACGRLIHHTQLGPQSSHLHKLNSSNGLQVGCDRFLLQQFSVLRCTLLKDIHTQERTANWRWKDLATFLYLSQRTHCCWNQMNHTMTLKIPLAALVTECAVHYLGKPYAISCCDAYNTPKPRTPVLQAK